jgi:hypothetical protein
MPFGLKNAPSEFQNIMNDIFTHFINFSIVYIDDVQIIKNNGLVVSPTKISLFQNNIRFLVIILFKILLSL